MTMNVGRPGGYHQCVIRAVAALLLLAAACGPSTPKSRTVKDEQVTCIGGLCVKPDHAVARKVRTEKGSRCVILAWDGAADLPPTAKVSVTDESPARPGVFLSVEVPGMIEGVAYKLSDKSAATAMAVRVDPAVNFADQRMADQGEIMLTANGDDMHVSVRTVWGTHEELALIVVPKTKNACGLPVRVD
jgi:hypothetical protein